MACSMMRMSTGQQFASRKPAQRVTAVAQELGAALGYMTLFMDLAAAYLGSPLLHQARALDRRPVLATCRWSQQLATQ